MKTKTKHALFGLMLGLGVGLLAALPGTAQAELLRPAQPGDDLYSAAGPLERITPGGVVSTFTGPAGGFQSAFDAAGNLFFAHRSLNKIEKITPDGVISFFAATGSQPTGLAFRSDGVLFQANLGSNDIRMFDSNGAGLGVFAAGGLNDPIGLAFDGAGNLYVANFGFQSIVKFSPAGTYLGVFASLPKPVGLAFDSAGNLYAASGGTVFGGSDGHIRKYSPTGDYLGRFAEGLGGSIAFDSEGNLYAGRNLTSSIQKYSPTGDDLGVFAVVAGGAATSIAIAFGPPNPNAAPTADAGSDQSIRAGDVVNLDGSASFDDNTASAALEYAWSITAAPAGSAAALDDASSITPSFTADVAGTYAVELVVTDEGALASVADEVEISSDNLAPTAVATADSLLIFLGDTVTFDGSGSTDPETDTLSYSWAITEISYPAGSTATSTATLVGDDTVSPTLMPDVEATYTVELTVSDFLGAGTPVTIEVVATTVGGAVVIASDTLAGLPVDQFDAGGHQVSLGNFLQQALEAIQDYQSSGKTNDLNKAINKLNDVIKRTDGWPLRGAADTSGNGKDWITDKVAQETLYPLLIAALGELTP